MREIEAVQTLMTWRANDEWVSAQNCFRVIIKLFFQSSVASRSFIVKNYNKHFTGKRVRGLWLNSSKKSFIMPLALLSKSTTHQGKHHCQNKTLPFHRRLLLIRKQLENSCWYTGKDFTDKLNMLATGPSRNTEQTVCGGGLEYAGFYVWGFDLWLCHIDTET